MSVEETQDKMSERSIRAFFGELLALCEKFAVVHLQASPCDRQVVAHFGVFGQGKVISYNRSGEPTVCSEDWLRQRGHLPRGPGEYE